MANTHDVSECLSVFGLYTIIYVSDVVPVEVAWNLNLSSPICHCQNNESRKPRSRKANKQTHISRPCVSACNEEDVVMWVYHLTPSYKKLPTSYSGLSFRVVPEVKFCRTKEFCLIGFVNQWNTKPLNMKFQFKIITQRWNKFLYRWCGC